MDATLAGFRAEWKDDLGAVKDQMRDGQVALSDRLVQQTRTFVLATVGSVLTAAGLAFGVAMAGLP